MVRQAQESHRDAARKRIGLALPFDQTLRDVGAARPWASPGFECIPRACRLATGPQVASRRDLRRLVTAARFCGFAPLRQQEPVAADLREAVRRWSSDHGYRPARLIERWLRERDVGRQVRGDCPKYGGGVIVDAATIVVQIGDRRWPV